MFGPINLAIIPIGAYEPRHMMLNAHVNPDEAVKLARQARNSLALGSPQVDLTLAFCLAKTGSTLGQEEALEITKKVLSSIGDQYPLLLLFAQKMLPKLISRKSFIWKGPEWHRLILS